MISDGYALASQVQEKLLKFIEDNHYQPGDRLPSENELARMFGVSRGTLREALRILVEDGRVFRQQGLGTFVSEPVLKIHSGIERLESIGDMIRREGKQYSIGELAVDLDHADKHTCDYLQLDEGTTVVLVRRVHLADGVAYAYTVDVLPLTMLGTIDPLRSTTTLLEYLDVVRYRVCSHAISEIVPTTAGELLAKIFKPAPQNAAVLLLRETYYDTSGQPFCLSRQYFVYGITNFHVVRKPANRLRSY